MFSERSQLIRVALSAVILANAVFTISRGLQQLGSNASTPWWGNAIGVVVGLVLWVWFHRAPARRETPTIHLTASVAVFSLLPPVAYGMPSTLWWLSLVPFALFLMASRRQAIFWAFVVAVVLVVATSLEPYLQQPGAAGESPLESILSRLAFTVVLGGVALAFRNEVDQRARVLRRATLELEASNAAKTRFMAQISHDLRNPLHGVLAMTDLAMDEALPAATREHLQTSQASARLLLQLVNDVLDVTRAEGSALVLEARAFDLHGLLHGILTPWAAQFRAKGLAFTATSEPGVPLARVGDGTRIAQIVMNLMSNALKFTDEGKVAFRLLGLPANRVRIEVEDTGRGVRLADRERIFQAFEQADRDDARLGGVGLGLAISRELARLMHGDLKVVEGTFGGSCFQVELELQVTGDEVGALNLLRMRPSLPPRPAPVVASLNVLIADDDPTNRLVLRKFLERLGHTVVVTGDGAEALEAFGRQRFDVVLTDAQMPVMSGLELVRALRADSNVPIVVCTASGSADVWELFAAAGTNAALWKPFVSEDVAQVLGTLVPSSTSSTSSASST